ncbi:MAG: S8 family serine peptidase, partial [Flavobacteriales bacterium]|nr:S8 family serine peptidase [Flavobacteriales bacterium]
MKLLLSSLFICLSSVFYAQNVASNADYFEGEIIVKIKPELSHKCSKSTIAIPSLQKVLISEKIDRVGKMFPNHQKVTRKKGQENFIDLSTIYSFKFETSLDERKILSQLRKDPSVQYAELNYINELAYTPDDSLNNQQWYLAAVNLFKAWDIETGDTSVVIAIVDTGSDVDHEDFVNDFAYNYNDPINGMDDDNDGYIDNFNGWDIANNDNDVGFGVWGHGTNVAGIASASTDNGKGISGGGFNTKILTVRIDNPAGILVNAYQGIVYAADHGAFIINNSWGSLNGYSQYGQDVVNYAAINKGCLVVAATGNDGLNAKFYPAAYENVLSVGSLRAPDTIKTSSNYGYWVDIFAPGESMYTCAADGKYQYNGGTSMASPLVAGIAGLVKSQFPNDNWEQVAERIRGAGDDIYSFNDAKYTDKLGAGRINAFKAVSISTKPGIKFINRKVSDNNDDIFALGDTIRVFGAFRNFLNNAQNASATISTIGNKLQILNPTISLGNINELDSVSIQSTPFEMVINSGIDFNEKIDVLITITADNYIKKQYFEL